MSFATERAVIEQHFSDNWTETQIAWDNVEFEAPINDAWVRLTIRNGDANQADINNDSPLFRYMGVVIVQIFVPIRSGTNKARELADSVSDIFRRTQLNSAITFRTPSVLTVGQNNEWYQVNVNCPFSRDEFE